TYYVQVRAVLESGPDTFISGMGTELSALTAINVDNNDGVKDVTLMPITGSVDHLNVKWDLPATGQGWNKIYVWRSFHVDQGSAIGNLIAMADDFSATGNSSEIVFQTAQVSNADGGWENTIAANDFDAQLGGYNCFLSRAVFDDGTYFAASTNDKVVCNLPAFNPPVFTGVTNVNYRSDKYDSSPAERNYGFLELNFASKPSGDYDGFNIYYSKFPDLIYFDFEHPIHSIVKNDSDQNKSQEGVNGSLLAKLNLSKIRAGYYAVRWYSYGSSIKDTNTVISSNFTGLGTAEMGLNIVRPQPSGEILEIDFVNSGAPFTGVVSTDARVIWSDEVDATGALTGTINELMLGTGACVNAPAGGPCQFNFSNVAPGFQLGKWIPRFYQVIGANGALIYKSPVFGHALVPDGMVYIDKNLWPQAEGRFTKHWERYSFALDRFNDVPTAAVDWSGGSYPVAGTRDYTNDSENINGWRPDVDHLASFCQERRYTSNGAHFTQFTDDHEYSSLSRDYHQLKAMDFFIAVEGTPDLKQEPGYTESATNTDCGRTKTKVQYSPWVRFTDKTEGDTPDCISNFGVRNLTDLTPNESILDETNAKYALQSRFKRISNDNAGLLNISKARNSHKSELLPLKRRHAYGATGDVNSTPNYTFVNRNIDWETGQEIYGKLTVDSTETYSRSYSNVGYQYGQITPGFREYQPSLGEFKRGSRTTWHYNSSQVKCSLNSPYPGKLRTQNDSSGKFARLRWRVWAENNVKIRIAVAKNQTALDGWDGEAVIQGENPDLFTVNDFSGCTDESLDRNGKKFNNHYYDLDEPAEGNLAYQGVSLDVSTVNTKIMYEEADSTDSFTTQGRCSIDLEAAGVAHWGKRWLRVSAQWQNETPIKGDTHIVGRVPDHMTLVAKEDWPDKKIHEEAAKLGEEYSQPYDFAIDKYINDVAGSTASVVYTDGSAHSDTDWPKEVDIDANTNFVKTNNYSATQQFHGADYTYIFRTCDVRTEQLMADDPSWQLPSLTDASYVTGKRVHTLRGIEFVVAGFGTPDAYNPTYCQADSQKLFDLSENVNKFNPYLDPSSVYGGFTLQDGSNYDPSEDQSIFGINGTDNCISRYGVRNMLGWAGHVTNEMTNGWSHSEFIYRRPPDTVHKGMLQNGPLIDVPKNTGSGAAILGVTKSWDFDRAFPTEVSEDPADYDKFVFGPGAVTYRLKDTKDYVTRGGRTIISQYYGMNSPTENGTDFRSGMLNVSGTQNLHGFFRNGNMQDNSKGTLRPSRFSISWNTYGKGFGFAVSRCAIRSPND
ncbi:hypothetical protein N9W79_02100, partial [bacterium]|nr:hypothetical protein [bacterium]